METIQSMPGKPPEPPPLPVEKGNAQAAAEGLSTSLQFVTFVVNDEMFGLPMANVREIIRMPDIVHVPLSPPSLEGLANLRGRVLPVIDLRTTFHFDRQAHGDATRVIVADTGTHVGLVVDRVASVIRVEPEQMESVNAIEATVDTQVLTSVVKHAQGKEMIMLLDLERLVGAEFSALTGHAKSALGAASHAPQENKANAVVEDGTSNEVQFVSFLVADQEYAFPIERVQEIVQVPSSLCHIPNTGSHVLGVMTLRDRMLPIVSLRQMFHMEPAPLEERNRIVVISLGEEEAGARAGSVGIVMDTVKEVLRLPVSLVEQLPRLLAQQEQVQEVEAICRLEDGKRLVSVLSVDRMFRNKAVAEAMKTHADGHGSARGAADGARHAVDDDEQMVVFRLGAEEYGVRIDAVQEILRLADRFTHVPRTASFIEGLVSLRGTVLPVIDLRRRFGLPAKERDERQRIMVFSLQGVRTGVIVDAVTEVLKVSRRAFEPNPSLSEEQARVIQRVANLEKQKRMVLVLEAEELFDAHQISQLAAASTAPKATA